MLKLIALAATFGVANAHISIWHPGMFGYNYPGQATDADQNYNNNAPVNPLKQNMNLGIDHWFAHGYKGYPPKDGDIMELPSGGTFVAELACNRAMTSKLRDPRIATQPLPEYACDGTGALHVMNQFGQPVNNSWFGGTALAISYTSDVNALQPSDMTVISVNYTSPWTRETLYQIPSGMPSCPAEGCLCTWNWIHQANHGEGYGPEIYNVLLRCKITGNTDNTASVPKGQVPKLCDSDPSKCVSGPKQPMYLWMADGNNMVQETMDNPTYHPQYGFQDGAQNDAISKGTGGATVNAAATVGTSRPASATASPSSMSVAALAAAASPTTDSSTTTTSLATSTTTSSTTSLSSSSTSSSGVPTADKAKMCRRKALRSRRRDRGNYPPARK